MPEPISNCWSILVSILNFYYKPQPTAHGCATGLKSFCSDYSGDKK